MYGPLKGAVLPKEKNLYYSFDCDENLYTYEKSKIKWANRQEIFLSIFFIENELFTDNLKKGVRGSECSGRTVQPTQLIRISVEAEIRALQSYREFFSNFTLVFELYLFLQKNAFLHIKLKF